MHIEMLTGDFSDLSCPAAEHESNVRADLGASAQSIQGRITQSRFQEETLLAAYANRKPYEDSGKPEV